MRGRDVFSTFRGHRVPNVNFIGRRYWWFGFSGAFVLLSVVGLFARGLNFSIDFKGGSQLAFPNRSGASVADYQAVMSRFGVAEAQVEFVGAGTVQIRTKSLTQLGFGTVSTSTGAASPSPSPTSEASPSVVPSPSASPSESPSPSPTPSASPTPSVTPIPSPTPPVASPSAGLPTLKGDQLRTALATVAGISANEINEQDVGPTWGSTISRKAFTGLLIFLVLVTLYITFRFELKMAAGALGALAHDLIITAGIYALVGRQVTPATVIAILTILGYSLYDDVVIFDKIKENTESTAMVVRDTYSGVVNMSLNQTLMRSVNTSLVVLLPIGSLLLFGGETLKDFAFALFVGVASGTYSSIFVAAPILSVMKEREPRFQQIRARAMARAARPGLRDVSAVAALDGKDLEPGPLASLGTGTTRAPSGAARPRPTGSARKKKRPQGKPKPRRR
jgi:preprotein translocase subunit SecF